MTYVFSDDKSKKDIQRIGGQWVIPASSTNDPYLDIPITADIWRNYIIIEVTWSDISLASGERFSTPITKGAGKVGLTGWGKKGRLVPKQEEYYLRLYGYNDKPTDNNIGYSIFLLAWK